MAAPEAVTLLSLRMGMRTRGPAEATLQKFFAIITLKVNAFSDLPSLSSTYAAATFTAGRE